MRALRAVYWRGGVSVGTAGADRLGPMAPIGCTRPKEKRADQGNRPNEPRKTAAGVDMRVKHPPVQAWEPAGRASGGNTQKR
ncbi:hypothetical protein CBM2589_A90468 [Cupriavidus taiwanensis]|uniref:Uncharacterized protein n=1 Tax=Cupriavidus taiwanensis TaxID=164546 RepID=A0A375CFG7_9BURK|nr:hypothetical protein CBM2589_A90468 [Cupriavidus taiwanensis]